VALLSNAKTSSVNSNFYLSAVREFRASFLVLSVHSVDEDAALQYVTDAMAGRKSPTLFVADDDFAALDSLADANRTLEVMAEGAFQLIFWNGQEHHTRKLSAVQRQFKKCVWLVPKELLSSFALRLDSHVFAYSPTSNNNSVLVEEAHSIRGGPTRIAPLATWNASSALFSYATGSSLSLEERRSNLSGVLLRNAVKTYSPFVVVQNGSDGSPIRATGFFPDVFQQLQKVLRFDVEYVLPPDNKWGALLPDGNYSGVIGQLARGEIDVSTVPLSVTMERSLVIDFSASIYVEKLTLLMRRPTGTALNLLGYLVIFSWTTWGALAGSAVILSVAFAYFIHLNRFKEKSRRKAVLAEVGSGLETVNLSLIQHDGTVEPEALSARMLVLVTNLWSFLIFAFYTADLTSRLTSGPLQAGIKSFQDVLDLGYQMIVLKGSVYQDDLANANPSSILNKIYTKTMQNNSKAFYDNAPQGIAMLMENSKSVAFGVSSGFNDPNIISLDVNDALKDSTSFGFPKDSEFYDVLTHYLSKMQESGLMTKIMAKWFPPQVVVAQDAAVQLGLDGTLFLNLIAAAGVVAAAAVLVAERIRFAARRKAS
jgi:ABC-type amino acid transport substrate-binding protein